MGVFQGLLKSRYRNVIIHFNHHFSRLQGHGNPTDARDSGQLSGHSFLAPLAAHSVYLIGMCHGVHNTLQKYKSATLMLLQN
jgi:hypothetical protein